MKLSERLRVLPMLLIVAGLCFTVRLGEFVTGINNAGSAFAQQEVKAGEEAVPPPMPADAEKHAAEKTDDTAHAKDDKKEDKKETAEAKEEDVPGSVTLPTIAQDGESGKDNETEWRDSGEEDFNYSGVQEGLYRDLTKRREDIEKREKALATRQALLEAAERELDQKVRELTGLRTEIEGLLTKQSEEELARTASLVRIYEGMKAKDAARIFNSLDTDVLLQVLTKMSERKSSPILAEMDAERARTITILMSQQQQLPQLPPQ